MKLTYDVLWFEDQPEGIKSFISALENTVEDYGFKFNHTILNSASKERIRALSSQLSTYNPYDLIIFDYDLGRGSETGLSIASLLRKNIYTDLIFYSGTQAKDLRKMLYEEEIDGVFIVHRTTFVDDVSDIIDDHVKRMSDLNNIRGVVMSAMSDIDLRMRRLLQKHFNGQGEDVTQAALSKLKGRLTKRVDGHAQKITEKECVIDLSQDPILTDFQNIRILLDKQLNLSEIEEQDFFAESSYLKDLQSERNNLAHQHEKYDDETNTMTLCHPNGSNKKYDFDEFIRLRKQLIKVGNKLDRIESFLED